MFWRVERMRGLLPAMALGICAIGSISGFFVARGIFSTTTFWSALLMGLAVVLVTMKFQKNIGLLREEEPSEFDKISFILTMGLQLLVLAHFWFARTDRAIASPWDVFSARTFLIYGLAFFASFWTVDRVSSWAASLILLLQGLLATSVSVMVYRLGFGYDPFVHQAAERYLVSHGTMSPPSLLYAGHYGLVVFLSRITSIAPEILDRWMVPLLAPIVLLFVGRLSLRAWSEKPLRSSSLLTCWLVSFLPLTFTVPHNLTYVLLAVTVLLVPLFAQMRMLWVGAWIALFALTIHPLLGIPIVALVFSAWLASRFPRLGAFVAFALPSVMMITAFFVYIHRVQGTILAWDFGRLMRAVTTVFGAPLVASNVPLGWAAMYQFFSFWPFVVIALGTYGIVRMTSSKPWIRSVLFGSALSVTTIALLLAAFVRIPNILPAEQFEFALRLRYTLPLFFLPGLFYLFDRWFPRTIWKRCLMGAGLSFLAVIIWYGSYPQFNPVMQRSAPGLGKNDVDAVLLIERLAERKPYAALTPQMVSAAALTQIGFERELQTATGSRYPYPIPTGGELYQYYLRFWYEADCHSSVKKVFVWTRVPQLFIVIPHAWDPRGVVRRRVDRCTSTREVVNGAMTIFRVLP